MRELTNYEVNEVSGAGFIANLASGIGGMVGRILDSKNALLYGKTTTLADSGSTLAKGVGQLLEVDLTNGLSNISTGISGVISAIQSLFSSSSTTTSSS